MRKTGKLVLICFILLQPFVWLGAVCGDNTNLRDSMACCKHAQLDSKGLPLSSLSSCCGHCNMGETSLSSTTANTVLPRLIRLVAPAPASSLFIANLVPS